MNKFNYKTYRIGNLSISVLVDEIILLYPGKDRIFEKSIKKGDLLYPGKSYIYIASILLVLLSVFIFSFNPFYNTGQKDLFQSYDEEKNDLLFSEKTDYSDEDKNEPLTIRYHVVGKGDTLSEIAKTYGVSMDTICGSNQLCSYDIIRDGTRLRIPSKDGILHCIQKGQDIVSVVKRYRVSLDKVYGINHQKNFDFVPVGSEIFIPDAKPLNIVPGFLWPSGWSRITSSYGWRWHPINGQRHFHQGMDIRSKYGLIRATKYGKVTFTGWSGGFGRAVIIAHPGGWKSLYGHLSRILVRPGQYVKQGQYIARSGNTGYSSGPHLHFELIKEGSHVNPYRYLKFK
jgi:murein DD-endopeptidase MepM/ murein hydrolase activator NlpD